MALSSTGFRLNVQLMDLRGNTGGLSFDLDATTYANASTHAGSIITALNAVTDATITGYNLSEVFKEDTPTYNGDLSEVASVVVRLANDGKKATLRIPAPISAMFQAASGEDAKLVDTANAALGTYVGLFKNTGGVASLSDGEKVNDTNGIKNGKLITRAIL